MIDNVHTALPPHLYRPTGRYGRNAIGQQPPIPDSPAPGRGSIGGIFGGNLSFSHVRGGLYANADDSLRMRFNGDHRFVMTLRPEGGEPRKLQGLQAGDQMFFRTGSGEILQAQRASNGTQDGFHLVGFEELHSGVNGDASSGLAVDFDAQSKKFESENGSISGRLDAEAGRISGRLVDADGNVLRFDGLVGKGSGVAVLDDGRSVVFGFRAGEDGGFVLTGFDEIVGDAPKTGPHPPIKGLAPNDPPILTGPPQPSPTPEAPDARRTPDLLAGMMKVPHIRFMDSQAVFTLLRDLQQVSAVGNRSLLDSLA